MSILEDFHMHTTFCDGKNTPEEMVLSAIEKGLTTIGFSVHTHTPYTTVICPDKDNYHIYRDEIHRLRDKYSHKLRIYCGIEKDFYGDCPTEPFDYVIGSVHHILVDGHPVSMDRSLAHLQTDIQNLCGGDVWPIVETYYRTMAQVVEKTDADIIGHLDLITKFTQQAFLFDQNDPRYIAASTAAADTLLKTGKPFEINMGAISRGYRTEPYPSTFLQDYLAQRGAKFILSSDSHSADTLCHQFDYWYEDLVSRGIPLVSFDPNLL